LERMSLLRRIVAVSKDSEIQRLAQQYGREVFGADDLTDALDIVKTVSPNLILFDHRFNPSHIHEFLNKADKNSVDIPVVVVGNDNSDTGLSNEFIRMGAFDYLLGRRDYNRLEQIINRIKNNLRASDLKPDIKQSVWHPVLKETRVVFLPVTWLLLCLWLVKVVLLFIPLR